MTRAYVGGVRLNQLVTTFGIGSVIDLPHLAVIVRGLDQWDGARMRELVEPRLLAGVRELLGDQVERLVLPPMPASGGGWSGAPKPADLLVGVPVSPFPNWYRCPWCGLLARTDSGLFDLRTDMVRVDKVRYVHTHCAKAKQPTALPARFLTACARGHMQDFPWVDFVHAGSSCGRPMLELHEYGVSGSASDIVVSCTGCGRSRRMSDAFDARRMAGFLTCDGHHPHLDTVDDCGEAPVTMLLGATSSWFAYMQSVLGLPEQTGRLEQLVAEHADRFRSVELVDHVGVLRGAGVLGDFGAWSDAEVFDALARVREGRASVQTGDLKVPEWEALTRPDRVPESDTFRVQEAEVPEAWGRQLLQVVLVTRLREVRALVGFTRLVPAGGSGLADMPGVRIAPLARRDPIAVPAAEVRGEGIFLRFREEAVQEWLLREDVQLLGERFLAAHVRWHEKLGVRNAQLSFPGMRFVLLHTFSHAVMRRIAIECGYNAAGIRERIYSADVDAPGGPMAGVLLYTAAPDSEGTLGGLVHLGTSRELPRILAQAFDDAAICSSDPLCSRHDPDGDGATLHGAACHACLFAPETSCEAGNRYLDRSVLVATLTRRTTACF